MRNQARKNISFFTCENCGTEYPIVDGVVFLLAPEKLIDLYPEICEQIKGKD